METASKRLCVLLVVMLVALSLIATQPVHAQSVPNPSVPDFTVKFVDRSYDVPITQQTTTDPFTGKQVTTKTGGDHITNKTIDLTIKNIPFTSSQTDDGKTIVLYYAVRTKGHFTDWTPVASGGYSFTRAPASNSEYTVVTLRIGQSYNDLTMDYADVVIADNGQEDFEVNAQVGYLHLTGMGLFTTGYEFEPLAESDWSNIQTLDLSNGTIINSSPSPSAVPELLWLALLPICLIVLAVALVLKRRRH